MPITPKISIVFPVYNGEKYVKESVDSLLGQTLDNFEIIIWDDGSTDTTSQILRTYRDPRIKFRSNLRNLGLFPTLNLAIRQSRGEYVRLWSQDDIMKPSCLDSELRYFDAHLNTALAYCAFDGIDDFGRLRSKRADIQKAFVVSPQVASEIMFYHGDITGNIANVMIRRSILERTGLFREDMKVSGDFELLVRLAGEYSFCEIHEPLIYLRTHKRQFSFQRGVFPLHMHENAAIYETLITRMTHIDREYAVRYHRYARHIRYLHYGVRSALLGDWEEALAAFSQLKQQSDLGRTILGYVMSGNARLYHPKPYYSDALVAHFEDAFPRFVIPTSAVLQRTAIGESRI
jgi:glycosyltransferase involved in cell wall biosynthesis